VHRHKKPSHFVGLEGDDAVIAVGSDGAIGAVFDAGVGQKGFEQGHRSARRFGVVDAFPKSLLFELLDSASGRTFAPFTLKGGVADEHSQFFGGVHRLSPR
jgi:hypothetical protein